jgi:hypothetical protein
VSATTSAIGSAQRRIGARNVGDAMRDRRFDALLGVAVVAAAALWIVSLRAVDVQRVGDLGIVSALPPGAFAALGLATAGFALVLRRPDVSTPVALLHLTVLILMLHGATAVIDAQPASDAVWRHAGATDHLLHTGAVDPSLDPSATWPGFFFVAALATRVAGLHSATGLSAFAPVAFELMYLPALMVIARAFTGDRRLAWTAVWVFYMTNWMGRDYLSPEAMAYLLYLGLVAVLLTCFARTAGPELEPWRARGARALERLGVRRPGLAVAETDVEHAATGYQRAALVPACVAVMAAAAASDQLTPWMVMSSVALLVGLRRCTARGLPLIAGVLLAAGLIYLARPHLGGLLGQLPDVRRAVGADASLGHAHAPLVAWSRLIVIAAVWGLAVTGMVRALRRGEATPSHAILTVAPAGLAALQPHGGELLTRIYLFSLPFAACYAARALLPAPGLRSSAALAGIGLALVSAFLITRYGNVRTTRLAPTALRAIDGRHEGAPASQRLIAAAHDRHVFAIGTTGGARR